MQVLAASPVTSHNDALIRLQKRARPVYTKTTGAETLTAAQVIDGIVNQNAAQSAFNLTLPTAALLVAAIKDAKVGDTFEFTLNNSAGGATITLVVGDSMTAKGLLTVVTTEAQSFVVRVDAVTVPAVTIYRA